MRFIASSVSRPPPSSSSLHSRVTSNVFIQVRRPISIPKQSLCRIRSNGRSFSVCGFVRIPKSDPTVTKKPFLSTMSCGCMNQLQVLHVRAAAEILPRKRVGTGIVRACSTVASMVKSSLDSLVLRAPSAIMLANNPSHSNAPQKSEEWFALRRDKLTTSTFSTALGFWKGKRRYELWHEKVFPPDTESVSASARAAMDWGVVNEATAIERYKSITGRDVSSLGFASHAEEKFQWIGASPDGLLGCYPGGGILEVKCPYNKGKPESGLPWSTMPFYYMPQVQGQMEILDREWADVYCWTPNGSTIFRVAREREYWGLINGVLREFWWGNVIPAREVMLQGKEEDVKPYEPTSTHRLTGLVIVKSLNLAAKAKLLCREIAGQVEHFK